MIKLLKYLVFIFVFLFVFASRIGAATTITISNPVISNDEVTIQVYVESLTTKNYLQGMFTKSASNPSYFGYTQNNIGDWYKYVGSPETTEIQSTFFSFTPENATWSGQLKIKNDTADPDYIGPGDYFLRVRRYTGNSSSGPTGDSSNDLVIQLAYVLPTLEPTSAPTNTPTSTAIPNPTVVPTKAPTPAPTKSPTLKPTVYSSSTPASEELVLGIQNNTVTPSPTPEEEVATGRKFLVFPFILIVTGFLCIAGAVFFFIKNNVKKSN